MRTNELLEEKRRTQKKMASMANHDIKTILDNAERTVKEMAKERGITLKYAKRKPDLEK